MTGPDHESDAELVALKGAMRAATPKPDPARKAAALARAQENFDALQGSRDPARHTSNRPASGLIGGLRTMFATMTSRGALTATTAIVACGFLILTPGGRDLLQIPTGQESIEAPLPAPPEPAVVIQQEEAVGGLATGAPGATENRARIAEPAPAPSPEAAMDVDDRAAMPLAAPPMEERAEADGLFDADGTLGLIAQSPSLEREAQGYLPEDDTEAFANEAPNPVNVVREAPVSTFSIDVDTASYAVVRQSLLSGYLPPAEAVRIEEMINYFPYDLPAPTDGAAPFRPTVTVFDTPWNPDTRLMHIGIQGMMPEIEARPPLNLVFLIDTSGSMNDTAKLPLLKQSFRLMLDELRPEDEVAIVEYAGSAGLVLPATSASERSTILNAINGLGAGGSTNGQGGLEQAYAVADAMAGEGEVSRILLATDGDFNVGLSGTDELTDYIAKKRETGTYLSVLGFGRGNLDDATMQALAQNGNGVAAYIDTLNEAQKVLVDQLTGALFSIAGDVKVQVEFNPAEIAEYRLIGYETRALRREDFNNDAVDAGELGAGHSVTAIYEVTPVGSPAILNDPLRYAAEEPLGEASGELAFLRLRWKAPGEETSQLIEMPIAASDAAPDNEARFAAAIAGFGQLLRDPSYLGDWGYDDAIALAAGARGEDSFGYRNEAVRLMRIAQSLSAN